MNLNSFYFQKLEEWEKEVKTTNDAMVDDQISKFRDILMEILNEGRLEEWDRIELINYILKIPSKVFEEYHRTGKIFYAYSEDGECFNFDFCEDLIKVVIQLLENFPWFNLRDIQIYFDIISSLYNPKFQTAENVFEIIKKIETLQAPMLIIDSIEILKSYIFRVTQKVILKDGSLDYLHKHGQEFVENYQEYFIRLAELMAKNREAETAQRLFFKAFDEYRSQNNRLYYCIFFENSEFARKLQERYCGVIILDNYPSLRELYRCDPFKFFEQWERGDKLPLLLDTIHRVSLPLKGHNKVLFEKFRKLFLLTCKECLILDGLFKYIKLAEIYFKSGREPTGFYMYQLICQEIEQKLLTISPFPLYQGTKNTSIIDLDPNMDNIHVDLHKKIIEIISNEFPIGSAEYILEISKIFSKMPEHFDYMAPEHCISLYESIIKSQPKIAKTFISLLKEQLALHQVRIPLEENYLILSLIIASPAKIIKEELISLFEMIDFSRLDFDSYEALLDAHSYLKKLLKD